MTSPHLTDSLLDLALAAPEALDQGGAAAAHLRSCAECAAELARLREALAAVAVALPPSPPDEGLRARLLVATRSGRPPESFARGVAELFDLAVPVARALLLEMQRPDRWQPGPAPGFARWPVTPGPRLAGANTFFLRGDPGAVLPRHLHLGEERAMVVQGGFRNEEGVDHWPGDRCSACAGSDHELVMLPGEPCISAIVTEQGVRFESGS